MATFAQNLPQSSSPLPWIRGFLTEELAPYPRRVALVARMTLATTLVMIITMIFRVPYGAYGAIYALTISREDPGTTVKAVKTIILGFALSVLYILAGALFFLQDPNLRLFWVIATLFVMFYCLSAAANYTAASRFGYLVAITIPLWDQQIPVESKVEGALWAFGAISLASLITVAIELTYAQLMPHDILLQPLAERLAAVEALLRFYATGYPPDKKTETQITQFALAGNSILRRTLQRSAYSTQYREQIGALVALVGRLVDIAANLTHLGISIPDDERGCVYALAENVRNLRSDLLAARIPQYEPTRTLEASCGIPLVAEMETTVSLIPNIFAGSLSLTAYSPTHSSGDSRASLFKPDAFTNPEHIKFGLKGCLAASLCYLIYNATAWPGISTAITTCFLTALSTVGSSRQKQVLRIAGAFAGGIVMGIGAEVFVLPYLDSIAGFTLLFIVATIVAAWFATASPRLSYFGVQVAVAFYLINLGEFKARTSLIPGRDRVVGIFLGLLVMWIVFDQLWGAPAVVEMKKTLISSLRSMAQFAREPVSNDPVVAAEKSYALRETINSNFDKVRALADGVLLEFGPRRHQDLALRDRVRQWQVQVRMLFLAQIATFKYRAQVPGFELPVSIAAAQRDFDKHLAGALDAMAARLEGSSRAIRLCEERLAPLEQAIRHIEGPQRTTALRLQAFFALYRRIERLVVFLDKEI
jgi:multidrug resistance protein MdtO